MLSLFLAFSILNDPLGLTMKSLMIPFEPIITELKLEEEEEEEREKVNIIQISIA